MQSLLRFLSIFFAELVRKLLNISTEHQLSQITQSSD